VRKPGRYWDPSWNITTGSTPVGPACDNCWARDMARRFPQVHALKQCPICQGSGKSVCAGDDTVECGCCKGEGRVPVPFSRVTFHADRLDQPNHWRKPRVVFVSLLGDLFHEEVTDHMRDRVFARVLMRESLETWNRRPVGGHTWLVLTKRPTRMAAYFAASGQDLVERWAEIASDFVEMDNGESFSEYASYWVGDKADMAEILPALWLGVSVWDQESADRSIPILLETPAAHRWVSYEPALGPVDLTGILGQDAVMTTRYEVAGVEWVVAGCESGPHARHIPCEWLRDVQTQCKQAGVPCFVKQASGGPGEPKVIRFKPLPGELPWEAKEVT
jgi:protein gp37